MRITLFCVGRLGKIPEGILALDYAARATSVGRPSGIGPVDIVEVESRKLGKDAEANTLLKRLDGAHLIACDEHGAPRGSREFAPLLARLRDSGVRHLAFVVGGADGLGEAILAIARDRLAFGPQTWPHALVRTMLAEQIYRGASILAKSPYHRG